MRDLLSWNLSLGRWFGVQVRLHFFFLTFVLMVLHFAGMGEDALMSYCGLMLGVLFLSVLAHEAGHCLTSWKLGGNPREVLLWPFGGLVSPRSLLEPRGELLVAVAGPGVNLAVCLALFPYLFHKGEDFSVLLNPLTPPPATEGITQLVVIQMTFWVNSLLMMVNLLPACPLDGGRILRCLLWPQHGERSASMLVSRAARLTAAMLAFVAVLIYPQYPFALFPVLLFSLFLFFSTREGERSERREGQEINWEEEYSSSEVSVLPHAKSNVVRAWFEKRREQRMLRKFQKELDDERRVDDVLARLHECGMEALSGEERDLLRRVSERYRNRQQK